MMGQESMDRQMFTAYILGTMPEADRLALAERYFADDELFDQLLAAENDLLDRYVRSQLGPEERKRFERYLHRLPDGRHKIGVATALMKVTSEAQPASTIIPERTISPMALTMTRRSRVALLSSVAAALIISATAIIWLIIDGKQSSRENEQLRIKMAQLASERQALEQDAQTFKRQNTDLQAQIGQLQKDLEQEQQRNGAQERQRSRLQALSPPFISLDLTAASRELSTPHPLYLRPDIRWVSLTASVEGQRRYRDYRAVVQTIEGQPVWAGAPSHPEQLGKSIVLWLPASQLPSASYKLTLSFKTPDGKEIARDYYFTVIRR